MNDLCASSVIFPVPYITSESSSSVPPVTAVSSSSSSFPKDSTSGSSSISRDSSDSGKVSVSSEVYFSVVVASGVYGIPVPEVSPICDSDVRLLICSFVGITIAARKSSNATPKVML